MPVFSKTHALGKVFQLFLAEGENLAERMAVDSAIKNFAEAFRGVRYAIKCFAEALRGTRYAIKCFAEAFRGVRYAVLRP